MITIYHNPRCSKSRATLAILEESGVAHEVVKYLETPLSANELKVLCRKLGVGPEVIVRKSEKTYQDVKDTQGDDWYQVIADNPILMQRPIVVKGEEAVVTRPPELVEELLK